MRPIFDNASLIDWLSSRHRDERYDYLDGHSCLISQYLNYRGFKGAVVDSQVAILPGRMSPYILPHEWNRLAWEKPWTFGAALDRARDLLKRDGYFAGRSVTFVITDEVGA